MARVNHIQSLLQALDSEDESVRGTASGELDAIIYPKSMPSDGWRCVGPAWEESCRRREEHYSRLRESDLLLPFMEALRAGGQNARVYSAKALGAAKEHRAIPVLIHALKDGFPEVRAAAAHGLWFISDPTTIDALAATLDDEDVDVRSAAAWALGGIRSPHAIAPLLGLLGSKRDRDRASALFALGELARRGIANETVLPIVRERLFDRSQRVKKAAKTALSSFDWKRREGGGM
jgi:HEAT repeat protein